MAINDEGDRLLLAHNSLWESNFYSVIAGYVEAGESLEGAVHREVGEEVGLEVEDKSALPDRPQSPPT